MRGRTLIWKLNRSSHAEKARQDLTPTRAPRGLDDDPGVRGSVTYAIGREPGLTDRAAVDALVKDLRPPGRGLRDMIHGIVASPAFQEN